MPKTHFNEHAVWMNLKSIEEFKLLLRLLEESYKKWRLLNWTLNLEKLEVIDDKKLGSRIHVVIDRPNFENQSRYLRGLEYREWETIKNKIYAYRRKEARKT